MFGQMYQMDAVTVEAFKAQVQEGAQKFLKRTSLRADLVGIHMDFLPELKDDCLPGMKVRRMGGVMKNHIWGGVERE